MFLLNVATQSLLHNLLVDSSDWVGCGIMCAIHAAAFGSDCNSGNSPHCVDWVCLVSGIRTRILSSVMLFSYMDGGGIISSTARIRNNVFWWGVGLCYVTFCLNKLSLSTHVAAPASQCCGGLRFSTWLGRYTLLLFICDTPIVFSRVAWQLWFQLGLRQFELLFSSFTSNPCVCQ